MTVATEAPATWVVVRAGGDIYWRAQVPAKALGAKVIVVPDGDDDFTTPSETGNFRWRHTDEFVEYPDIQGTVVWTRPCVVRAKHGAALAALGHRNVAEVDDNFLSKPSQNIFMLQNGFDARARNSHMRAFASMDGIVCSTEWLREFYFRRFRKELRHAPDMYVARNHVDRDDPRWCDRERDWGRIRVGIQGSYQHVNDWRLAAPALALAAEMGCELVFMGLDPAEHDPNWKRFLGDYVHIPWTDADTYHRQQIPFDIGLAPLVTTAHTLGKSDVKALEYAMSGVASVLQNNPVYNREWTHGETALLAGSPDEMAEMMAVLVMNSRLRSELIENARQYVMEERTIQGNLDEWVDALNG
jgi:glycosyltransferase involved in cell wall biosynthesis